MSAPTYDIPAEDRPEFAGYPPACRVEVEARLRAVEAVQLAARGKIGATCSEQGRRLGIDGVTMRKFSDRYANSGGDWRELVDRRRYPDPAESGLPPEIRAMIEAAVEDNQRGKAKAAHRRIIALWRSGDTEFPWPEMHPKTKLPRGLDLRNFRRYLSDSFARKAMQQGLGVALALHGPKLLTTRFGLWVGSHYLIDDLKRDLKMLALFGRGGIVIPQEFGVLDLYSASRFAVHRRPMTKRGDGSFDCVKEFEMRFLLANVFRNTGFSRRGTEIVMEWGTATVRRLLAAWLLRVSGGKITTRGPGITGKEQAIAGWRGSGGGNPRHKAALESHHNYLHNETAHLPAPTGHDRTPPEWLHGVERDTELLLDVLRSAPPALATQCAAQMLEWWQGLDFLQRIDRRVDERRDHELQGWVECGHTRVEFCVDLIAERWIGPEEFLSLDARAQDRIRAAAEANPMLRRVVKLAPREVFGAGVGALERIPDHEWAMFFCERELGEDLRSKKRSLNGDGDIELMESVSMPEPIFFRRELVTAEGGRRRLEEKDSFTTVLNPFDLGQLWVYDLRGGFLGTAPGKDRVSPLDGRAIELELGHISHEKAVLLAPLGERHAGMGKIIAQMQENNAAIAQGLPSLAERRTEAAHLRKHAGDIKDFLPVQGACSPEVADGADFGADGPAGERGPDLAEAADFLP